MTSWDPIGTWVARVTNAPQDGGIEVIAPGDAPPQLIASSDCQVLLSGTLHDRRTLAASVDAPQAAPDAELVRLAYRREGSAAFRRLRGRHCALVADGPSGRSICVRDPSGSHPVFYAETADGLLVSPGIDALVGRPGVSDEVNRAWVAGFLFDRWTSTEDTFFTAVRRLLPGRFLEHRNGRWAVTRYWEPRYEPAYSAREAELVDELDAVTLQAVARRLDDNGVGILLSGGLDSAAIAALAVDVTRSRGMATPVALSIVMPPPANEDAMQRRIARSLSMPRVVVDLEHLVDHRDLVLEALTVATRGSLPPVTPWQPAYDEITRAATRRGARTLFGGQAGDDLFFHPRVAADLLRRLDVRGMYSLWRAYRGYYPRTRREAARNVVWAWAGRLLVRRAARRLLARTSPALLDSYRRAHVQAAGSYTWFLPDPVLRAELQERWLDARSQRTTGSFAADELGATLEHPNILYLSEFAFLHGSELGASIELPFLDPDVVELVHRVPLDLHTRDGTAKWLVRKILEPRVGALAHAWPQTVYGAPFLDELLEAHGPQAWLRSRGTPVLGELGIIDTQFLSSHPERLQHLAPGQERWMVYRAVLVDNWLRTRTMRATKGGGI